MQLALVPVQAVQLRSTSAEAASPEPQNLPPEPRKAADPAAITLANSALLMCIFDLYTNSPWTFVHVEQYFDR